MSKPLFDLTGKTAIVTGGTKGIGLAISLMLADHGADVVVAARTAQDCEDTAKQIESMGRKALACPTDVSKLSDISNLFKQTMDKFGKVDIVVNNSGVGVTKPATFVTEKELDSMLNVNIKGVYFMCMEAAKIMKNQPTKGNIVNISSTAGFSGTPMLVAYGATKAAVSHLTKGLAAEWARDSIRVNAVAPGSVPTEMTAGLMQNEAMKEKLRMSIPLKKFCSTDDIAVAVLYLASDEASVVTGETIIVDGGFHAV